MKDKRIGTRIGAKVFGNSNRGRSRTERDERAFLIKLFPLLEEDDDGSINSLDFNDFIKCEVCLSQQEQQHPSRLRHRRSLGIYTCSPSWRMFDVARVESANNNFPASSLPKLRTKTFTSLGFLSFIMIHRKILLLLIGKRSEARNFHQRRREREKGFPSCSIMFEKKRRALPSETLTSTLRAWRASTNVKMKIAIVFRGEEERVIDTTSRAWNAQEGSNK